MNKIICDICGYEITSYKSDFKLSYEEGFGCDSQTIVMEHCCNKCHTEIIESVKQIKSRKISEKCEKDASFINYLVEERRKEVERVVDIFAKLPNE